MEWIAFAKSVSVAACREAIMGGAKERWWQPVTTRKSDNGCNLRLATKVRLLFCFFGLKMSKELSLKGASSKARIAAPKTNNIGR